MHTTYISPEMILILLFRSMNFSYQCGVNSNGTRFLFDLHFQVNMITGTPTKLCLRLTFQLNRRRLSVAWTNMQYIIESESMRLNTPRDRYHFNTSWHNMHFWMKTNQDFSYPEICDVVKSGIGLLKFIHGSDRQRLSLQSGLDLDTVWENVCKNRYHLIQDAASDVTKVGLKDLHPQRALTFHS